MADLKDIKIKKTEKEAAVSSEFEQDIFGMSMEQVLELGKQLDEVNPDSLIVPLLKHVLSYRQQMSDEGIVTFTFDEMDAEYDHHIKLKDTIIAVWDHKTKTLPIDYSYFEKNFEGLMSTAKKLGMKKVWNGLEVALTSLRAEDLPKESIASLQEDYNVLQQWVAEYKELAANLKRVTSSSQASR